jgi:putative oxidoreductase
VTVLDRSQDGALLLGRLFVAALFVPSGFSKLMTFSSFAASLAAKGLPYPSVIAGLLVAAELLGPLAMIIGLWPRATALLLIGLTAWTIWTMQGPFGMGLILRPRQNPEFFQSLALVGGLLFYFASGPGGWSRTRLR